MDEQRAGIRTGTALGIPPIGWVRSALTEVDGAPRQADEDAPPAVLDVDPAWADACAGIAVGDALVVVTWLHAADRTVTMVHPRDDTSRPRTGVFATRSPHRPNPIGLHDVTVTTVEGPRIHVAALDAVDGTPILDLKPRLEPAGAR